MRFEEFYRTLSAQKYYVFSLEDACAFFPREKKATIKQHLCRWKKSGFIVSLRKGLYELRYPAKRNISDMYIANKLYTPSYVSLETALSHYSIIPEVAMTVTSLTPKATRHFKNSHGLFLYKSIQPQAFFGYTIEKHNGFDVLIAEPEKALADYLYFKNRGKPKINFEDERLDKKIIRRLNKKRLNSYGQLYKLDLKKNLYAYL